MPFIGMRSASISQQGPEKVSLSIKLKPVVDFINQATTYPFLCLCRRAGKIIGVRILNAKILEERIWKFYLISVCATSL